MDIKWQSTQKLSFVDKEIETAFTELIHTPWSRGLEVLWHPSLDMYESDEAYVVQADLPGLKPDTIGLEAQEYSVTICGERKLSLSDKFNKQVIYERSTGRFCRTVSLPGPIESEKATVSYKDGIYEVVLPKKRVEASKRDGGE
ncbi:Hsp20/alpha crystallin family protein [Chitinispirillales bacterium ANBcel5]|uniref:Hsp20/alpha crystallin family protein n=1 Tax=Cellulosispirillum alkaliphilum TaxID=3039283 RepID=UPI002A577C11|nr:Hsp20/alpha crystallin family protein [Chitinispirillales bacterium ANBcel5]